MAGALNGIRVIELGGIETLYAGKLMADQQAEVVLVEPPEGHRSRRLPPYANGELSEVSSVPFTYFNGNKASVSIDLATPDGIARLDTLIRNADVVLAGGMPSILSTMGLDPARISGIAPRVVLTTITPFGWTGPRSNVAADDMTLQALGGLMNMGGRYDGRPLRPPGRQAYVAASLFGAIGTSAALLHRSDGGPGQHVDVSIQESVVMALENSAQFYDMEGTIRTRHGGRQLQVGRGVFACADGYVYLMLGLHAGSKFWPLFCDWMSEEGADGAEKLRGSEWHEREFIESDEAKSTFERVFGGFCSARTKQEIYAQALERRMPLAPVNNLAEVLENEQLTTREFFQEITVDEWRHGPATAPGAPYRMSATPWSTAHAPPTFDSACESLSNWNDGRGHAPADETAQVDRPLSGVRVIDFCWVGAGAYTTRILADLGADIIKIESSKRIDQIRLTPPFKDRIPGPNRSGYFADRNAGKRGITIDLKTGEGRELVLDMAESAHIVANNFSPGTLDRLGLGYSVFHERCPGLVYVEMSMQGRDGPHSRHLGYGMTIGALAGLQHLVGEPGYPPTGSGTNYPDHIPSPGHGVFAILMALIHRHATGEGQYVELAQTEATVASIGDLVLAESIGHHQDSADNVEDLAIIHDAFVTKDDRWIAIAVYEPAEWWRLLDVLALPSVIDWAWALRADNRQAVRAVVTSATRTRDAYSLMDALHAAGIRAGVVQSAKEVVDDDPQLEHRQHWVRLPHPEIGDCLYNALPIRMSRADLRPLTGAPCLGQHTDEVLREFGLSDSVIAWLAASGALT